MEVHESTLRKLLVGERQLRVPLYQRQYTWRRAQHETLWDNVLDQYDVLRSGQAEQASTHFLGAVVLASLPLAATENVHILHVVDGQQRITTLLVALAAIRDLLTEADPSAYDTYSERFLINRLEPTHSERRLRLLPSEHDRPAFRALVEDGPAAVPEGAIRAAYEFFADKVRGPGRDAHPLDPALLTSAFTDRLSIVDITASTEKENVHRIFESLNATGVSLTQADLLRNYLFMRLRDRSDAVYDQTWRPMEQHLGFEHLEGLSRVDLLRRGTEVKYEHVYWTHRKRLDAEAKDADAVEAAVKDLALRARHYKRLVEPEFEPDAGAQRHLAFLRAWGATTTFPLLMHVLDRMQAGECSVEQWRAITGLVESFIVRRHLAAVPTNYLNKLFVLAIGQLSEHAGPLEEKVHRTLSHRGWYWPSDEELESAVQTNRFYLTGRWHQRKLILERLEESFEHPEPVNFAVADLTIEHILPQTLSVEWRQELEGLGQIPEQVRDELGHTLGNLTLTAWNGRLSNKPFERKQQIYGQSNLVLNHELGAPKVWGRSEILERGKRLAVQAAKTWPAPVPGIGGPDDGFDWSRIDAAVEAIPEGRWTAYVDLAELGGTAPMPVGQYISGASHLARAYRVLSASGRIRPGFKWHDSAEARDPVEILRAEGVEFDGDAARRALRLNAADLAALVDEPD